MPKQKIQLQTFNDGIVNIYSVGNTAPFGGMPKDGLKLKVRSLRYKERTVGMNRYWAAMQSSVKVDMVIRVPYTPIRMMAISTQDIVIPTDGEQYRIVQIQKPEDIYPPVMDLSLERLVQKYDIAEP